MRMTNIEYSERSEDLEYKNKEIDRFESNHSGIKVIKDDEYYKSLDQLEDDWNQFKSMPYEFKMMANDKSLQLFGYKNDKRYVNIKSRFLKQNIDRADVLKDIDYLQAFTESFQNINENEMIIESYSNAINESTDMVEIAWLTYSSIKKINESSDTYFSSISKVENFIGVSKLNETNPNCTLNLGNCTYIPHLLPEEILNSVDVKHETEWFNNYRAKLIGLKPVMEYYSNYYNTSVNKLLNQLRSDIDNEEVKSHLEEFGIIPFLITSDKVINRVEVIMNENTRNFKFIDITSTPYHYTEAINEEEKFANVPSAIVVYHIAEGISKSRVAFSLNLESPNKELYSLQNGDIHKIVSLEMLTDDLDIDNTYITVYYLPINSTIQERISKKIDYMTTNMQCPKKNYLRDIYNSLGDKEPTIGNFRLFYYNFINLILSFNTDEDPSELEVDGVLKKLFNNENIYTYILYRGRVEEFEYSKAVSKILSMINMERNNEIDETHVNEGFLPYMKLQVFNEYAKLPVEFDKDGNIFIRKKEKIDFAAEFQECHRMLIEYNKVKNYDALKYYVAKLWYMNIIIEKKLYTEKKSKELTDKLPYYYKTRAHILSDFHKYIEIILGNEPEFNFKEYYETTPFDKSVIKISKGYVKTLWDYISKILSFLSV